MGGILSTTEELTKSLIWPISVMNEIETTPIKAMATGAGAVGAMLYVGGNPIKLVERADFVTIAFGYGAGGVAYYAVDKITNKFD